MPSFASSFRTFGTVRTEAKGGAPAERPHQDRQSPSFAYLAIAAWAAAIFAFTASRLKLAPFCIGGNSIAVIASFSTSCWTKTKRQNSYLNQSKYCCAPSLVPLLGHPVRSNGSRRRLVI